MWELILKSDFEIVNDPDSDFVGIYNTETDTIILNVGGMEKIFRDSLGKNWAEDDVWLDTYIYHITDILEHESIHEGIEKAGIVDEIMKKFNIPIDLKEGMEAIVFKHFFHELYAEILSGTNWDDALRKAAGYFDNKLEKLSEIWAPIFAYNPRLRRSWHRYGIKISEAGLEIVTGILEWLVLYQRMLLSRMEKELEEEQAKGEISEEFREKGKGWLDRLKDFRNIEE